MPAVQNKIKEIVVNELKTKLNTELSIEELHIQPFNTIELKGVDFYDQQNQQVLKAERLYAKVAILQLLNKRLIINAVRLDNFEFNLSKETPASPLNIQFAIDAFKSDNPDKKPGFDVKVEIINISDGNFRFDVKDKPYKQDLFDANHIQVSDLDARLSLKSLKSDSLNIQVKQLSLKEKSGFEIKNLIVRLITQDDHLYVKGFELEMPKSLLQLEKCEVDLPKSQTPQDLIDKASFECIINSSYITPQDVSAFTPALKNFKDRIYLKAGVSGTLDSLKVSELSLDYGDKMHLVANAMIKNFRQSEDLYLSGSVDEFNITPDGIVGIIDNLSSTKKNLPHQLLSLGTVSFKGDVSGKLDKLKAYGLLHTQLGSVQTDLIFGFNPRKGVESYFNGNISTDEFQLGRLLNNEDFDRLSFDLAIDLEKHSHKKMGGNVKGHIDHFDYKKYSYNNITLNGSYDGLKIEGQLDIDDENVILGLNGLFDLTEKQPELNFTARLKNLRMDKLHLSNKYPDSYLSLNIDANFIGSNIDDAAGYISIDSLRFLRSEKNFSMQKLLVEASGMSSDRKLKITSDIINGEVLGAYSFTTMVNSIKHTLYPYLPALITHQHNEKENIEENALELNFTIGNTETASDIFSLPFTVFSEAKVIGSYNNHLEKIKLDVYYPSGKVAGIIVKSGELHLSNNNESIITDFSGIMLGKNNVQNDVKLQLTAQDNTLDTKISFTNNSRQRFKGDFFASATFSRADNRQPLQTDIYIKPSDLVLSDTIWQINESQIRLADGALAVNNLHIHNNEGNQAVNINGKYSNANPDDVLRVDLKNINLEYVFSTLAIDALNFGGLATGSLYASSVDQKPYMNVELDVLGFKFNNTLLGNLNLYSELDEATKKVVLKGNILDSEKRKTDIDGFINPITQELSINFDADKVNVGFLNKYVSTLFNNIKGQGSGKVRLYGDFKKVTVEGKAFVEDGSIGINFLNTTYTFTDTIYLKKDLIYFNNIQFSDQHQNIANISGKVVHDFFADFMYFVDMSGKNFMLYNAPLRLNPMFYGKVFASGTGSISGDEQVVNIDARLKTEANTNLTMNFMEESVDTYSFITYRDKDSIQNVKKKGDLPIATNALKTESGIEMNISLYIDATPDAEVELVMDPVGGDMLKGSGTGALQFIWGTSTDPQLFGTYVINKGSYNFTFQKIIERKFSIRSGSSVFFRGDPFQANLNVDAIYRLMANLSDLDRDLAESTGQLNVPVECILNITGELQHPNIGFDVSLPSVDGEVQRQVKSLMNTEDMVNRQMVYLLLLSKFYTPNYANIDNKTNDLASLASATLSTQLSKILSTIDDRWQVGTNIRTSDSEFTSTEVELLLSSQLLNDRVLLNGNFGYIDNPQTQAAFIGDVDVEVLLNRVGTWRLKAYNHYNEKYYYINASEGTAPIQTQGIGIMYKKDFDHLREVFGIKPRLRLPKTDTITPIIPDSTIKGSALGDFIRIKK